jgi:hypothetical protein
MNVREFLRRSVERKAKLAPDTTWAEAKDRSLNLLKQLPAALMVKYLAIGYLRYSHNGEWDNGTPYHWRACTSLVQYRVTCNRQYLVDALNYCLLEWIYPTFEGTFFKQEENPAHVANEIG